MITPTIMEMIKLKISLLGKRYKSERPHTPRQTKTTPMARIK